MSVLMMLNESNRWRSVPSFSSPCWKTCGGALMVFRAGYSSFFLLTLPQMRNRYSYFKIGPYLNLLLPSSRLICRSVAEGFSLMTLLGRGSESRHISPFQFPFCFSLSLFTTSSHRPPVLLHRHAAHPSPKTTPPTSLRLLELKRLLM